MSEMSSFGFENSLTTAMNRGAEHQFKLQRTGQMVDSVGNSLIERLFGDKKPRQRADLLMQLEIVAKKRQLGLPTTSEDLENLLNENQTLMDPGRAVTLGAAAYKSTPIFKFGASPFFGGFEHGKLGAIARIFK